MSTPVEQPGGVFPDAHARKGPLSQLRSALLEFVEFLKPESPASLGPELIAAQREVVLSRVVILIWISTIVMPTTIWSYVYFTAPEQLEAAVWIVLLAIVVVLALRSLVIRGVFDRFYHLAMLLLVGGVFGPTGAAIIELTHAAQNDFFFAFFLIYFAFAALFPAHVLWILMTSLALITSYTGARLFRPEQPIFDGQLVSNLIYLVELTLISVILNRVVSRLYFDERRSRIQLARANESLRELDRAKTQFFSIISHEIRTPLTLILTPVAHLLQRQRDSLPTDLADKLEGIFGNAGRLLKMVNMLLDFAKLEAGKAVVELQDIRIGDLLDHTCNLFRSATEARDIRLELDNQCGALTVMGDLDKLEQMLVNLIGNAIKFTPAGGRITVGVKCDSEWYELYVSDTGLGIPKHQQKRVFERFAQVESPGRQSVKGTGIGLSMVQKYAELLGGSVGLESEPGRGSTFTIRLPIERDRAPLAVSDRDEPISLMTPTGVEVAASDLGVEQKLEIEHIDRAGPGRPWILIVDDNPGLVRLVASVLEDEYNLLLANSGERALKRLGTFKVDVVISDVMMPGISGLELCRRIKRNPRTAHVPVILLTARGGSGHKVEGLEHGADDYVGKPFDPAELRARVRSLLDLRKLTRSLADKSHALEDALKRLQEEELKLVESEKMRTLGDLAAGIIHELHNFLNMICNGAEPLRAQLHELRTTLTQVADGQDVDELLELAKLVLDAAGSARAVTMDLKAFAYHDSDLAAKDVDIRTIVRSTVGMHSKRSTLRIELILADEPLVVHCVPTRLSQVFTNLLSNAADAMKGEGTITVQSRHAEGRVEIVVEDEGPGVAPEFVPYLFEPFKTTKKQGDGLGLGLSLARKVVHDFSGALVYEPRPGGGARFRVELPASQGASHPL